MALEQIYQQLSTGQSKYVPVTNIGEKICDLSVNVRLPRDTALFDCVQSMQECALAQDLPVHVLSEKLHITFANPLFLMEGRSALPSDDAAKWLFRRFAEAMHMADIRELLSVNLSLRLRELLVRQRDVKLIASTDDDHGTMQDLQKNLEVMLKPELKAMFRNKKVPEKFIYAEGHPNLSCTVLRYKPGFSQTHYDVLTKEILARTVSMFSKYNMTLAISRGNMTSVRFDRLFEQEVEELPV